LRVQFAILSANRHCNIELHRKNRVCNGFDGLDGQRRRLVSREVSAQRSPRDCNIDLAGRERIDQLTRRIWFGIVTVNRVTADVPDDATCCECVRWRHVARVIADHM
jgi:hypothetical protein